MRIVTALLVLLTLFFAASLVWPSRYDIRRETPTAAPDSAYLRGLRSRPAPDAEAAFTDTAADLYSVRRGDDVDALANWMQLRAWRRFLGVADATVVDVGAAIDAGRSADAELAGLRGRVVERALAPSIDAAVDPALLERVAAGDEALDAPLEAVAPGLWVAYGPLAHGGTYPRYRVAVALHNASDSRVRELRLVFLWNGDRRLRIACEPRSGFELPAGMPTTLWCEGMTDDRVAPIDWLRGAAADGAHRLELDAAQSRLALPDLGFEVPRFGNRFPSVEAGQRADQARYRVSEQHTCFELGNCAQIAFSGPALWITTFALALAAIGVWVTARALGGSGIEALLLGAYATFAAGSRALLAADADRAAMPWPRAATWLVCCALLAAFAWSRRAPLSDWRAMRRRPSAEGIFDDFAATAKKTSAVAMLVYGALLLWFAVSFLLHR